ncbi:MAG: hypothetical protein AB8G22_22250 [Saprospiraceae bacterium]
MSVSFYQIMYSGSNEKFEKANDSKSTPIYKLNSLSQGEYFRKHTKEKYGKEVYDFASDKNLVEESGLPPLSTDFLEPESILNDLNIYKRLLIDIKSEISSPLNELLSKEIKWWNLDIDRINWIENEITELEKVCNYAKDKNYLIKFACDY